MNCQQLDQDVMAWVDASHVLSSGKSQVAKMEWIAHSVICVMLERRNDEQKRKRRKCDLCV
jgi:hypothetical protein